MKHLLILLTCLLVTSQALANGLYISERGTRGLARGGAFVAGANGLDAVGYNPAGLRGTGMLGELTLPIISASYQRKLAVTDSDTGVTSYVNEAKIKGHSDVIPFPTLVGAYTPESEKYTVAFGLITPTFSLMDFPNTVHGNPSPARYTLSGFTDSRIVMAGAWLRLQLHERFNIGAGVHALIGTFRSTVGFTLSPPDRVLAAPEDPDYDARGRISVGPMVAPSGSLGLIANPIDLLKIGLSFDLPIWINSSSTFDVRLPDSAAFNTVKVNGNKADLSMRLPAILRAGVELKPIKDLAVEVAYVREFWSLHDTIKVKPDGISISGVPGGPDSFSLPKIVIPRHYRDTNAFRLGGEFTPKVLGFRIAMRAGVAYEQSAVPPAYLSLSSLDTRKVMISLGGGLYFTRRIRGDLTYAYLITSSTTVSPEQARIPRINPLTGNAPEDHVNGGRYELHAQVLSGALSYVF